MTEKQKTQEKNARVKKPKGKGTGTIFDDTFRTIQQKMPRLLIPIVNDAFGTHYSMQEEVRRLPEQYREKVSKVIMDSCSMIGNRAYHLEVQSYKDGTMALRMVEYDFMLGIADAKKIEREYYVYLPKSCVIYLRSDKGTPNYEQANLVLQGGRTVKYRVPTVKVQDYAVEEIFAKELYAYLPFYLMRYEKEFPKWEKDEEKTRRLQEECDGILTRLSRVLADKPEEFQDLLQMMRDVTTYLLRKQETLQERMGVVMGGKVLPLPSDRLREVEATTKAKCIMDLLSDLGEVPKELGERIYAEKGSENLSKMLKLAAKASSIEDFQEKLSAVSINASL